MKKNLKLKYPPPALLFKQLLLGILLLVAPVYAQGQTKTISGIAMDEQKFPIPGVSVTVKGAKQERKLMLMVNLKFKQPPATN